MLSGKKAIAQQEAQEHFDRGNGSEKDNDAQISALEAGKGDDIGGQYTSFSAPYFCNGAEKEKDPKTKSILQTCCGRRSAQGAVQQATAQANYAIAKKATMEDNLLTGGVDTRVIRVDGKTPPQKSGDGEGAAPGSNPYLPSQALFGGGSGSSSASESPISLNLSRLPEPDVLNLSKAEKAAAEFEVPKEFTGTIDTQTLLNDESVKKEPPPSGLEFKGSGSLSANTPKPVPSPGIGEVAALDKALSDGLSTSGVPIEGKSFLLDLDHIERSQKPPEPEAIQVGQARGPASLLLQGVTQSSSTPSEPSNDKFWAQIGRDEISERAVKDEKESKKKPKRKPSLKRLKVKARADLKKDRVQ